MASSNPNQQDTHPYLINPYGKPISRLVRTKDNHQDTSVTTKQTESVISQPSLLVRKGRNEQPQSKIQSIGPSRVADLSTNVVFQDVDSPTRTGPRSSLKQQSKQSATNQDKGTKLATIGLIGNVFTEATTKYTKVPMEHIKTPNKNIENHDIVTHRNSEAESASHNKFSRKREVQPPKIERHNELTLNLNIEQAESREEGWATDRSANDNGRKIERKTDRARRQLKFGQKKQTRQQEVQNQNVSQLGEQSRISENTNKNTIIHKQTNDANTTESTSPKPKPYQPIRRTNIETPTQAQTINTPYERPANIYRPTTAQQKPIGLNKIQPQTTQVAQQQKQEVVNEVPQSKPLYGRPKVLSSVNQKVAANQLPLQNVAKQQPKKQAPVEPPSSTLKKSALVGFAIKRLLLTQLTTSFAQIKFSTSQLKTKATKYSLLLSQSLLGICRHKENNLMRWSFDALRLRFSQSYVNQLKNVLLYKAPNRVQISLNILQKICQSKVRQVWKKLSNKHLWSSNQVRSFTILDHFCNKKVLQQQRLALHSIALRAKIRISHFNNLNTIITNLNKQKVGLAFIKILAANRPESKIVTPQKKTTKSFLRQPITPKQQQPIIITQTSSALQQKTQKLKAIVSSVKDNLNIITKKLKDTQAQSQQQKHELQQKVVSLKQANQQIQNELNSKKGRIQVIQKELSSMGAKAETKPIEDELEILSHDDNLQKLTKIYMSNYKNREESITPTQIFEEYQLNVQNCSKSYKEWQLLADNINLKRLMASYQQHAGPVEFKARKMALGQQQVAAKLVRSYIKQQYFWEWLHLTAQSIQSK